MARRLWLVPAESARFRGADHDNLPVAVPASGATRPLDRRPPALPSPASLQLGRRRGLSPGRSSAPNGCPSVPFKGRRRLAPGRGREPAGVLIEHRTSCRSPAREPVGSFSGRRTDQRSPGIPGLTCPAIRRGPETGRDQPASPRTSPTSASPRHRPRGRWASVATPSGALHSPTTRQARPRNSFERWCCPPESPETTEIITLGPSQPYHRHHPPATGVTQTTPPLIDSSARARQNSIPPNLSAASRHSAFCAIADRPKRREEISDRLRQTPGHTARNNSNCSCDQESGSGNPPPITTTRVPD